MKKSIKITLIACLIGLMTLALSLGFVLLNGSQQPTLATDGAVALQGEYDTDARALFNATEGKSIDVYNGATYTAFDTMSKISKNNDYLLIVVGIDDVDAYSALGMSVKKNGAEQVNEEIFDGKTYYDGITYLDGTTQTLVDIFGATNTPEGMMVIEVAYDETVAYRVSPSLTQKADSAIVYAKMLVNKTYEVASDTATCATAGVKTYAYGNDSYQVASAQKEHNFVNHECTYACGTYKETTEADGLQYTLSGDYYHVTGYTGKDTTVVIPGEYNGKRVTSFPGANSGAPFQGNTTIEKVVILGHRMTNIGKNAFNGATNLKEIIFTDEIWGSMTIGYGAFSNTALTEFIMPKNSGATVSSQAFYSCKSLTKVDLKNVTSIEEQAFANSPNLVSITVSEDNEKYKMQGHCLIDVAKNLAITAETVEEIVVPAGVTTIGHSFLNMTGKPHVVYIPTSVTTIKDYALRRGMFTVNYAGTQEQWEGITKGTDYNATSGAGISGSFALNYEVAAPTV